MYGRPEMPQPAVAVRFARCDPLAAARFFAVIVVSLAALVGPLAPGAAAFGEPNGNISGQVEDREGPLLDSFRFNSGGLDDWTMPGSAEDPGSNAAATADLTYTTTLGTTSVTVDARGNASANTGAMVRKASAGSSFSKQFQVLVPSRFSATGSVSVTTSAGHCCVSAEIRLVQANPGIDVFRVGVSTGDSGQGVSRTGIVQPGLYRLDVQASVGMGFGAAASPNDAGSAAFDTRFTLTDATDTDGDALLDVWETDGIDTNDDGTIDLDLPAMGADPRGKDIFLELDFMAPHDLDPAAVTSVVAAFAAAPVTNPDGSTGIALHIDNGPGSIMNPRTGASWGARSRHDTIGHLDTTGEVIAGAYDWTAFDVHKAGHFETAREQAFHYAISAHGHAAIASGIARDIPSSDLLITLGAGCQASTGSDCTLDATAQAGTLMHELGHNLGLHHGGGDELPNKPNYLSVMNYSFQLTGLMRSNLSFVLDYSRFAISVDEKALDELHGFGVTSGPAAGFNTLGKCPSGLQTAWFVADGPTDFNCDGPTTGTVAADINGDGAETALAPFIDWPALVYAGGAVGGSGVALPSQTPLIEPQLDELLASKKSLDDYVAAQQKPPGSPAQPAGAAPRPQTAGVPALRALRVKPAAFPAVRRGRRDRRRLGARVTYALAAAGRVRFRVERSLPGRRSGARCVPVSHARRGRACLRAVPVAGSIAHSGRSGTNSFAFGGRIGGRVLRPGSYVLVGTALADDGRPGSARRAPFRVLR